MEILWLTLRINILTHLVHNGALILIYRLSLSRSELWGHWELWLKHGALLLPWKHDLWCCKVVGWMHHLEDIGHSLLSITLHAHSRQLCLWDCRLVVSLFDFLVGAKVLGHYSADLSEVFEHSQPRILLLLLLSRAELVIVIVHIKSQLWTCPAKDKRVYR